MTYDHVVIGGGVSGLTTALTLALWGQRVAVVEAAPATAPILRGFVRDGVYFDTGFHYAGGLGAGDVLDVLFRYLGLGDKVTPRPLPADGFDLVHCPRTGAAFRFPTGYPALRDRLSAAFPEERAAVTAYLDGVEKVSGEVPFFSSDPERGWLGGHDESLQEFFDRHRASEWLQAVLACHCLLYGVPPVEASFWLHAQVVGPYYRSACGIEGGGRALARALDQRLAEVGVSVRCGQAATQILFAADGSLAGVELAGGERLACRGVVATVHPQVLLELVPPGAFKPAYRHRLARLEETSSAFKLYGISPGPVPGLAGANAFLCCQSGGGLVGSPLEERPLYVAAAPEDSRGLGRQAVVAICPADTTDVAPWSQSALGARPSAYRVHKEAAMATLGERLGTLCPGFQPVDGATPLTLRHYGRTPTGGLYGAKHKIGQINPQPLTRVEGLRLAGQSVVAPGVLGAMLSAFVTCGTVVGHGPLKAALEELR